MLLVDNLLILDAIAVQQSARSWISVMFQRFCSVIRVDYSVSHATKPEAAHTTADILFGALRRVSLQVGGSVWRSRSSAKISTAGSESRR